MSVLLHKTSGAAVVVPRETSEVFQVAAAMLRSELVRRFEMPVEILESGFTNREKSFGAVFQFETIDTLSDEWMDRLDPPVKILHYADYADHVGIRSIDRDPPRIVIVAGSDRSLPAAAGLLLRHITRDKTGLVSVKTDFDYQPLMPVRAALLQFNPTWHHEIEWSRDLRNYFLTEHALRGNNYVGLAIDPALDREYSLTCGDAEQSLRSRLIRANEWLGRAKSIGQKTILTVSCDALDNLENQGAPKSHSDDATGIDRHSAICLIASQTAGLDALYFTPSARRDNGPARCAISPTHYFHVGRSLYEAFQKNNQEIELWLGVDGFSDDEISAVIDCCHQEPAPYPKALVCESGNRHLEMVRREMPLNKLFLSTAGVTLLPEGQTIEQQAHQWLETFYHNAPLSYGVLTLAGNQGGDLFHFVRSMLSWHPQPPFDELFPLYAEWYLGRDAAPLFLNLTRQPVGRDEVRKHLEEIKNRVPSAMRELAESKLKSIERMLNPTEKGPNDESIS